MNYILFIYVPLIIYALYKNGREVYHAIVARDSSRLKGTLFFFFLTVLISTGLLLWVQRIS